MQKTGILIILLWGAIAVQGQSNPGAITNPTLPHPRHLSVAREQVLARGGLSQTENRTFVTANGYGRILKTTISKAGAASLRLHFRALSANATAVSVSAADIDVNWMLIVSSINTDPAVSWVHSGNKGAEYKKFDVTAGDDDFWTDEIPGNRVTIELINYDPTRTPKLQLVQTLMGGPVAYPQSIWGQNDIWDIASTHSEIPDWKHIQAAGKSVARLRFVTDEGVAAYCTAFVVAPALLLTNDHCVRSDAERKSTLVDFNYISSASALNPLRLSEVVAHDEARDYSLLRLVGEAPAPALPVTLERLQKVNTPLFVIEHPAGDVKSVSVRDCAATDLELVGVSETLKCDFGHRCDTLGGSSGSPVFRTSPNIAVVGLHHLGFYEDDPSPVNQAVLLSYVIEDIGKRAPVAYGEIVAAQGTVGGFRQATP